MCVCIEHSIKRTIVCVTAWRCPASVLALKGEVLVQRKRVFVHQVGVCEGSKVMHVTTILENILSVLQRFCSKVSKTHLIRHFSRLYHI